MRAGGTTTTATTGKGGATTGKGGTTTGKGRVWALAAFAWAHLLGAALPPLMDIVWRIEIVDARGILPAWLRNGAPRGATLHELLDLAAIYPVAAAAAALLFVLASTRTRTRTRTGSSSSSTTAAVAPSSPALSLRQLLAFALAECLMVQGHGIHLVGNAVDSNIFRFEPELRKSARLHSLVYFADETAGHLLWFAGHVCLVVVFAHAELAAARRCVRAEPQRLSRPMLVLAGLVGVMWWMVCTEGQQYAFGITVAVGFVAVAAVACGGPRAALADPAGRVPVIRFFCVSYLVAIVPFAAWIWAFGHPVQFSDLGLFDSGVLLGLLNGLRGGGRGGPVTVLA